MEMFLIDICRKINTLEMLNNCDVHILLTILSDLTNQFFPKKRFSRKQYKVAKNPWIKLHLKFSLPLTTKISYMQNILKKEPQFLLPTTKNAEIN